MNLPLPVAVGLWIALGVAIIVIIVFGLIRRRHDGEDAGIVLHPVPEAPGTALTDPLPGSYVSTTRAGDWLTRIGVHGLGNRARAVVQVWTAGVLITRAGEPDIFIPSGELASVGTSNGQAGKFVGHGGLDVVTWSPVGAAIALDTAIRFDAAAERTAWRSATATLLAASGASGEPAATGPGVTAATSGAIDQQTAPATEQESA